MTSIIKRGRFYWIDYYHDGKRKRQSLQTDRLLEAKDRARQIEESLYKLGAGPLLSDFAETYFAWARATKPASAPREKQRWDKIMVFLKTEGVLTLPAVSPLAVEKLRAHLLEDHLAKATVNRYLQLLRGMFYRAVDWGLYSGPNPLKKIKFFREDHIMRGLSTGQIETILELAKKISAKPKSKIQHILPDLILFDLNTGLRRMELLNLRWADIGNNELHIKGKGSRIRRVPLNQTALEIISRQPKGGVFVFDVPNRGQGGLLRRTTDTISKRAGFRFHLHQLRHTLATNLLARGVDIVTIAEILGHSRATVSLIYAHSSPESARRAVSLLDSQTQ